MRALYVSAIAFMVMAAATVTAQDYDSLFLKFKKDYNRQYASATEEASRRAVFEMNMRRAAELQKRNPHATFGVNEYADISAAEFKKTHHAADFSNHMKNRKVKDVEGTAGSSIDWREKGAVTHVKNQANCGGCWSFSTTGNIEGQWFLAGNPLTSLSEQELLSCDTETGNSGCKGGLMDYAFEWLTQYKSGNIDTAASYPFVDQDGITSSCHPNGHTVGATISGHFDLPQSESKIATQVFNGGPVSIGVDAASFQSYNGGILSDCQYNGPDSLDHAVLIVGYDDNAVQPYWIIKNSWGPGWGESGYIRVAKGSNQCGLQDAASTSTVTSSGPRPPTPPPVPAPPTPVAPPTPSGGTFTQKVCVTGFCLDCQSNTFDQNKCLKLQGGGSAKAVCTSSGLEMTSWTGSDDCSGSSTSSTEPVNQCLQDQSGSYIENVCNSNAAVGKRDQLFHKSK